MDRSALLRLLDDYEVRHPDEQSTVDRIRVLLRTREDAYRRDCFAPGHITTSAWIVSRESGAALFTHHRKLNRWLQLGGHADGDTDVLASAIREAEEESGLRGFQALPLRGGPAILDLDVHRIPARGAEPAHEHHDVRFLLEVSERQQIVRQAEESHAVRWFDPEAIEAHFDEESVLRMGRKADLWRGCEPVGPPVGG
jgi:8-oxo-dGTP pyrophosphatase MutT (NUDIX family)